MSSSSSADALFDLTRCPVPFVPRVDFDFISDCVIEDAPGPIFDCPDIEIPPDPPPPPVPPCPDIDGKAPVTSVFAGNFEYIPFGEEPRFDVTVITEIVVESLSNCQHRLFLDLDMDFDLALPPPTDPGTGAGCGTGFAAIIASADLTIIEPEADPYVDVNATVSLAVIEIGDDCQFLFDFGFTFEFGLPMESASSAPEQQNGWLGKTMASHGKGDFGDILLYDGAKGAETPTGQSLTNVYNRFIGLESDRWVHVYDIVNGLELTAAECNV